MEISDIRTPALIIDKRKLEANVVSMAKKAKANNVSLRPHIKTHKCLEIARIQEKYGIKGITVSTLREAEDFSNKGFFDITYAVPIDDSKFSRFIELNDKKLMKAIVDDYRVVERFSKAAGDANQEIEVLVKVDMGYHRCGVDPTNHDAVDVVRSVVEAENLKFKGLLTHAGNSYSCNTPSCIERVAEQEQESMISFARTLSEYDYNYYPEVISIGSTPTMALAKEIRSGITEIRPGNYVYYDYSQVKLGVCRISDCALTVIARIVGKYGERAAIDAGATALSKDRGPTHIEPKCGFGKIFRDYEESELDMHTSIDELSQEHGKVSFSHESIVSKMKIGDLVRILPNHACLTNNLFRKAYVVVGDKVLSEWQIFSGHS
ncbi:MAG: alanine racemase [Candidatus Thorarchaeota archaeon]